MSTQMRLMVQLQHFVRVDQLPFSSVPAILPCGLQAHL
jgi:hypothetical protein